MSGRGKKLDSLKVNLGDLIGADKGAELEQKLVQADAREGDTSSDQEIGDEPAGELGGFRPASDILAEAETEGGGNDIGTAATAVMPKSDPPQPLSVMVPPPAPVPAPAKGTVDPAQNVELTASMQLEAIATVDRAVDQNKIVTEDVPVVDPASAPKPPRDFNTGEQAWLDSAPTDDSEQNAPASEPPPAPAPAPVATPEATATAAAVPAAPRPNHQRVAMPPATPARLFWMNYRSRILFACIPLLAVFAGCLSVSWFVGYRHGLRDRDPVIADSTAPEAGGSESDPTTHVVAEEPRPTRAVMPPERSTEPRSEPGLTGVSGTVVRLPARDAYPTSCRTAGTREGRIPGVTFLCGRDWDHGPDVCNCVAAGRVP